MITHASDLLLELKERLAAKQAAASALKPTLPNQEHALPPLDLISSADSISSSASRQVAKEKLTQLEGQVLAIRHQQRFPSSAGYVSQRSSSSRSITSSPLGLRSPTMDIPSTSMSSPEMPNVKMHDILTQVCMYGNQMFC
jgi:hypothetical protein